MLAVSAPVDTIIVGEEVTFNVMITNVEGLFGFQFDVNYNADVLEFVRAKEGTFLSNSGETQTYCIGYDASSPGLVENVVCTRLGGGPVDGDGLLETLTFKAVNQGSSDITLSNIKLAKPTTENIEYSLMSDSILVE